MDSEVSGYLVVVTATASAENAAALARGAVAARLAASGQIVGPITSVYWWDGKMQEEGEYQIWFQLPESRYEELTQFIEEHHDYELPEVISWHIEKSSRAYLGWLDAETTPRA